jgi:hypothetical protein
VTITASATIAERYRIDGASTVHLSPARTLPHLLDDLQCPSWCVLHMRGDDGEPTHLSNDATMRATAGGPAEHSEVSVSVERAGAASAVRIQNAGDTPMTADEALHLAGLLILAARRATEPTR